MQPQRLRIGASSLLDDIEAVLGGGTQRLPDQAATDDAGAGNHPHQARRRHAAARAHPGLRRRPGRRLAGAKARPRRWPWPSSCSGLSRDETVALTRAMTAFRRGARLAGAQLHGPVLDKHSTGGVGDKVSLMLAPILAACGARGADDQRPRPGPHRRHAGQVRFDPRLPDRAQPGHAAQRRCARPAAPSSARRAELAPADRRLYAIRDVTATVESIPLITASILSKKLAAGLQGLVMDVKCGNGAFADTPQMALALARSLVARGQRRRAADARAGHRHEPGARPCRRQCAGGAARRWTSCAASTRRRGCCRSPGCCAPRRCRSAGLADDETDGAGARRCGAGRRLRRCSTLRAWWRRSAGRPTSASVQRATCRPRRCSRAVPAPRVGLGAAPRPRATSAWRWWNSAAAGAWPATASTTASASAGCCPSASAVERGQPLAVVHAADERRGALAAARAAAMHRASATRRRPPRRCSSRASPRRTLT